MHSPRQLPPELRGVPFTVRDARVMRVTWERTRASDLDRPFRGIRAPHSEDRSFIELCQVYAAGMPDGQYFSHTTAARLLGLPLPWEFQNSPLLHVTSDLPRHAPRARGIVGHHAEANGKHLVAVGDLRVTSAVQTWCDLATVVTVRDLVIIGDALVRRKHPFATLAELQETLDGWCGRRGARLVRVAFE